MTLPLSLLAILDARSFSSLWYWVIFAGAWTLATRNVLGMPSEIVLRAHRRGEVDAFLDWLALALPRWRMGGGEGMLLAALAGFVLTVLAVLGFVFDREAAQALFLLLGPLALLLVLRVRLANRLAALLGAAEGDSRDALHAAAAKGARRIILHGWLSFALALLSILLVSMAASLWFLQHPFGH